MEPAPGDRTRLRASATRPGPCHAALGHCTTRHCMTGHPPGPGCYSRRLSSEDRRQSRTQPFSRRRLSEAQCLAEAGVWPSGYPDWSWEEKTREPKSHIWGPIPLRIRRVCPRKRAVKWPQQTSAGHLNGGQKPTAGHGPSPTRNPLLEPCFEPARKPATSLCSDTCRLCQPA